MASTVEAAGGVADIADGREPIEEMMQCLVRIVTDIWMRQAVVVAGVVVSVIRRTRLLLIISVLLFNGIP